MNTSSLIQEVWNFCHTLKDDGVGYGDYLEQLTYLLFLKMAHEFAQEPYLLHFAFSGQLVPQNPTDERASMLLERIRSGRQAAARPARTTGPSSMSGRTAPC